MKESWWEMQYSGEEACFVCGARYRDQADRRAIVNDDKNRVFYINQCCYQRVRDIRRADGGTPYQGLLKLGENLSQQLFGKA